MAKDIAKFIEPKFMEVQTGRGTRRIAYLKTDIDANSGSNSASSKNPPSRPGLIWLPGFKSRMTSIKGKALADFASAEKLQLTRFDYSGHGASSGKFKNGTIGRWLNDSGQVFKRLSSGPQILVASSMGGWLALLLAHRLQTRPSPGAGQRIKGLVLLAPGTDMSQRLIHDRLRKSDRRRLKKQGYFRINSRYDDKPYIITHQLVKKGRKHCFNGRPIEIDCPVHILHGVQDPDVPWQNSLQLTRQITQPDVRLTLIKDGDHRLSRPQDLPVLFDAVRSMVRDVSS